MACGSENQVDLGPGGELAYDPKTVATVSGEVVAVNKSTDLGGLRDEPDPEDE